MWRLFYTVRNVIGTLGAVCNLWRMGWVVNACKAFLFFSVIFSFSLFVVITIDGEIDDRIKDIKDDIRKADTVGDGQ